MLTLLSEEKGITPDKLNDIIVKSRSEYDFDVAIKPFIRSESEFREKWANKGFSATKVSIWEILLKSYYRSSVENALQISLKIKHADIANNVEATNKIYREVAQDLASSGFSFGSSIHKAIQDSVKMVYNNSRQKYQDEFRVFQNDPDINPAVLENQTQTVVRVTDGMEALKNIPPAEVKALLADIYKTRHIYKFETVTTTNYYYSMYESFLRVYFQYEMQEFNENNKGQIQIVLSPHNENKYKKLDSIMSSVLKDFILQGISADNIVEFQHAVFVLADDIKATSTVPIFGQKPLLTGAEGNFGTGNTFASPDTARGKFDTMIKGFIALSKVYHYLRDAGFTPYHIHPDIFRFTFEDPSNKFLSLAEVVQFSKDYVEVRDKYGLTETTLVIKALQARDNSGLLLPRNYDDVILANRNNITLQYLTDSVVSLTSEDPELCYATAHMVDIGYRINIFTLSECLQNQINPLYFVFEGAKYEWPDEVDPDEVLDQLVIDEFFDKLIGGNSSKFRDYHLTRERFLELVEITSGDMRDLFDDLVSFDTDIQINIINALKSFVFEFKVFIDAFNEKYIGSEVSEVEYSTFLYKHPMFTELHSIIDPAAYKGKNDNSIEQVTHALLRKYYPELTLETLQEFLDAERKNISYSNFVDSIKSRTFKDITTYFYYAKANLYNLTDTGRPIKLSVEDLQIALNNAPPVTNYKEFQRKTEHVRVCRAGYLVNSLGNLYKIVSHNNKVGALHSSGLYIFTDKTAIPWGEDL